MSKHTFSHSDLPPSRLQQGLDPYDRDTLAYLAMAGVEDTLLARVAVFTGPKRAPRYDQCDDTCTVDCGHCKGAGKP